MAGSAFGNVRTKYFDLERGDTLNGRFDLVISTMTLHHVKDVQSLLRQLANVVAPSGNLCVADLDLDDGLFHESNEGVFHQGFDREAVQAFLRESGLTGIRSVTAAEMNKQVRDGGVRNFTVFLIVGNKSQP